MTTDKNDLKSVIDKLRTERDELRVQIHLASMEAKQEWDELEKKWDAFEQRLGNAKDTVVETTSDIGEGIEIVADEIKSAYARIRQRINDNG